ncbi:Imm1 family immunity protein [Kribbella pittospori]|uniref:Imm1 family immunity protein n=1 Tax=Kribbella pittospori TaxID=722689 RepID=UPI0013F4252E|nr:Imm1 family immunity protein [Kribbella pittospori]
MRDIAVGSQQHVDALLADVAGAAENRHMFAIEVEAADGSSLIVGLAETGVVLLFIDALGNSVHSVGPSSGTGKMVVFDYFGSYTEVPAEYVVSVELGRAAMWEFIRGGDPVVPGLLMEPD